MPRKLPPFAAVRAFEAVARRGRLQEAAEELHLSAPALSHQVRALETFLGVKLFTRDAGGLTLTEPGRHYLAAMTSALDRIDAATLEVTEGIATQQLNIHLSHSLAELWLIPRVGDFLASNPDIGVRLVTAPERVDFSAADLHIAFRYSCQPPEEPLAQRLIDEVIMPVASPDFLVDNGPYATPACLLDERLIGCDACPEEWRQWFRALGVSADLPAPALVFDTRVHALRAAEAGYGLAMHRRPSGDDGLRDGTLVAPFAEPMATGAAYWLVAPERSAGLAPVKQFLAWAMAACAEMREG